MKSKRINKAETLREELLKMSPITSRYLCIVCPNCRKPEPVPVYRVVWQGSTRWVCRSCLKWFPRE